MTNSYGIHNHFKAGKTYSWAQYVDKRKNGGNGNGFVDGNESKTFIDIIEDNPKEKKIIPLFVDLKNVKDGHELIDEIIKVNIDLFSNLDTFKYFIDTNPADKVKELFNKHFNNSYLNERKDIYIVENSFPAVREKENIVGEFVEIYNFLHII